MEEGRSGQHKVKNSSAAIPSFLGCYQDVSPTLYTQGFELPTYIKNNKDNSTGEVSLSGDSHFPQVDIKMIYRNMQKYANIQCLVIVG